MRPELEQIIPDEDAFLDFLELLHANNFYQIQEAWKRKGIVPVGELPNPKYEAGVDTPFFRQYDFDPEGDFLDYPLVRVNVTVSLSALLLRHHTTVAPLPEVIGWFCELYLRYGELAAQPDASKVEYRLMHTNAIKNIIRDQFHQVFVAPLNELGALRGAYSTSLLVLHLRLGKREATTMLLNLGYTTFQIIELGAMRVRGGRLSEFNEMGEPLRVQQTDEAFSQLVDNTCRIRKLQRLIEG